MRFIFFIIALKIKKYPLPCKYLLQKIYNLTKLSLSIFAQKFTEIDLEPPNLLFLHKVCNVCTKFKKDLVIFKKKQWCLKCFFNLKKDEGIVYASQAFYFKNGLNPFICEKCWAYPIMIHFCEDCNYRICSNCFDSHFILPQGKIKKRCSHKPSQFMKIKN